MTGGRLPLLGLHVARVSPALPWLLFSLGILELQGLIQLLEHLKACTATDLKGEIFSIQWFLLWLGRGGGTSGQCSLSTPWWWLRARLSFFAEIFFLRATVSPRTGTHVPQSCSVPAGYH